MLGLRKSDADFVAVVGGSDTADAAERGKAAQRDFSRGTEQTDFDSVRPLGVQFGDGFFRIPIPPVDLCLHRVVGFEVCKCGFEKDEQTRQQVKVPLDPTVSWKSFVQQVPFASKFFPGQQAFRIAGFCLDQVQK